MTPTVHAGAVSQVVIPFGFQLSPEHDNTPSWAPRRILGFDPLTFLTARSRSFPASIPSCPLNFAFLIILSLVLFSLLLQTHHRPLSPDPRLQHPKSSAPTLTALLSNKSKLSPRRCYQDALKYDRLRCGAVSFPAYLSPFLWSFPPLQHTHDNIVCFSKL